MNDILRSIMEMFGLLRMNPEVQEVLEYDSTPGYTIIFFTMLFVVVLAYAIQYHIIDRPSFSKRRHLVIMMACAAAAVFTSAVLYGMYQHPLSFFEILPSALSATIWSVVAMFLLTQSPIPRGFSTNCRFTKLI
ncbi:MAG: hypothetical protein FGM24_08665 [Candidatus Kapabacteria bacterium]|nr:hypothetical protein [Candidatus Kapabacteria bacterium]